MENIPRTEINWEFVEPLNDNALKGVKDQFKVDLSDAFKDFIKLANYGFSQWRSFMVGNETYAFKHVLNFNLESESLLVILMQSLLALIFKDRFFKSYRLL
ncbi:SMI1/KNR4 family protein [Helicobacter acinonychis]|uniref:SMI1/KNR4 family protein n=1 Tax=Helicobacter acinonychis TaxID=212 RepID=UPI000CF0CC85|nr:SMI1/KNR4 family protein [Helicobacter acinonychis]STP09975.1 cell division protein [Helicobacter acinonychis]